MEQKVRGYTAGRVWFGACNVEWRKRSGVGLAVVATVRDCGYSTSCTCRAISCVRFTIYALLLTPGVKHSSASVCVSVCPHENQNGWNYNHQSCHRDTLPWAAWVQAINLILGQKVNGQGHRETKCKNTPKTIEWPAWVCTLSSAYRLYSSQ